MRREWSSARFSTDCTSDGNAASRCCSSNKTLGLSSGCVSSINKRSPVMCASIPVVWCAAFNTVSRVCGAKTGSCSTQAPPALLVESPAVNSEPASNEHKVDLPTPWAPRTPMTVKSELSESNVPSSSTAISIVSGSSFRGPRCTGPSCAAAGVEEAQEEPAGDDDAPAAGDRSSTLCDGVLVLAMSGHAVLRTGRSCSQLQFTALQHSVSLHGHRVSPRAFPACLRGTHC